MMLNLNPIETELTLDALKFYRDYLDKDKSTNYPAHLVAGRFVCRRIDELMARIEALKPKP